MRFDGWIPTVTGHLSFTAIGGSSYPSKCISNRSGDYVCVIQNRDLLDVVIPYSENNAVGRFVREYFSNYAIGISGYFCFAAFLQRHDDGQSISGTCFVIPLRGNRKAVRSVRQSIGSLPTNAPEYPDASRQAEIILSELSVCTTKVNLARTGHAIINTQAMRLLEELSEQDEETLCRLVANQVFYFLKDVAHVHQHHDPKQDAITEVTRYDQADPDRWIEKTQNALYREIIRFKRFRNEQSLFRASGVLSYAKSFQSSIGNSSDESRLFNTDELEVSLAVSREELKHNDQKRIAELDSVRNWFFALFGFIISASFLVRTASPPPDFEVDKTLITATRYIAENPVPVVFFVLFVSVTTSFFTHRRDPANFQVVRAVLRWSQGFRMRWYFVTNLIFTLVFSFLFYVLLVSRLL